MTKSQSMAARTCKVEAVTAIPSELGHYAVLSYEKPPRIDDFFLFGMQTIDFLIS